MALLLRKRGFKRVRPLTGGLHAWRELGMPVAALAGGSGDSPTESA